MCLKLFAMFEIVDEPRSAAGGFWTLGRGPSIDRALTLDSGQRSAGGQGRSAPAALCREPDHYRRNGAQSAPLLANQPHDGFQFPPGRDRSSLLIRSVDRGSN